MSVYNNITYDIYGDTLNKLIDRSITNVNENLLNGITTIGKDAFRYCYYLTNITIPNTVTSIDRDAFYGCSSLTNIIIPASVSEIAGGAFENCSRLTSVTILATTPPTIGYWTFEDTPIESGTGYIYVPAASVNAYKESAYWSDYVDQIRAIPE